MIMVDKIGHRFTATRRWRFGKSVALMNSMARHGITVLRDRAASYGAKDHKETRGREPPRYVNVIRIGSEFEAWHRQTRLAADCLFLPLALLAAQAHLRIFFTSFLRQAENRSHFRNGSQADMARSNCDVCFTPTSRHRSRRPKTPLFVEKSSLKRV
jgi:hypothetical protein